MMCPWCGARQSFDMAEHLAIGWRRPEVVVIPPADKRPRKKPQRRGKVYFFDGAAWHYTGAGFVIPEHERKGARPARAQNGAGAKGTAPSGGQREAS